MANEWLRDVHKFTMMEQVIDKLSGVQTKDCFSFSILMLFSYDYHILNWLIGCLIDCLSANRPFPNNLWPLFQSESWCSSCRMKISFHLHVNEN